MTYAKLVAARGIKEPAAVRLVQSHKRERQSGNASGSAPLTDQRGVALTETLVQAVRAEREATARREALTDARRPLWRWMLSLPERRR